jgi:hypothetical protein
MPAVELSDRELSELVHLLVAEKLRSGIVATLGKTGIDEGVAVGHDALLALQGFARPNEGAVLSRGDPRRSGLTYKVVFVLLGAKVLISALLFSSLL